MSAHGEAQHTLDDHGAAPHALDDDGEVHPHIAPTKLYVGIFLGLVVLTVLTVGLSLVHLGPLNLAIAVVIATTKAGLVVTFFMHLKDDNRFNALIFLGSLFFAGAFLMYTLNDTDHRGQVDRVQGTHVNDATGERAPGGMP